MSIVTERRRIAHRDVCEIESQITCDGTPGFISCMITDISETGARVELFESVALPEYFSLSLPLTEENVDRRDVELRWRDGRVIGVRFMAR